MDILHLRYFSSVYETLNFSHSAERLYISRQALRQAIRSIEVELCQPLFVNRSNKLWATRAADTLYQESCEVLRAYRNLENSVEVLKTQSVITANCGLVTNQADCYTDEELEWLSSYDMTRGGGGQIDVRYFTGNCSLLRKMVLDGSLDCAVLFITQRNNKKLDYYVGRTGQIQLFVHRDNPLAGNAQVTIADLRGQRLVTQGGGYDICDLIMNRCAKSGFKPDVISDATNTADALNIVNSAAAVTYGLRDNLRRYRASNTIAIPFAEPFMVWHLATVTKKGQLYEGSLAERFFCHGLEEYHRQTGRDSA